MADQQEPTDMMGDSLTTVHVAARKGHINSSSGTADFGVGYKVSVDGGSSSQDEIEREYNLRASQIMANKFNESGR